MNSRPEEPLLSPWSIDPSTSPITSLGESWGMPTPKDLKLTSAKTAHCQHLRVASERARAPSQHGGFRHLDGGRMRECSRRKSKPSWGTGHTRRRSGRRPRGSANPAFASGDPSEVPPPRVFTEGTDGPASSPLSHAALGVLNSHHPRPWQARVAEVGPRGVLGRTPATGQQGGALSETGGKVPPTPTPTPFRAN